MSKEKIFISGGAGFIGSQVNELLQAQGYDTIVFDNLSSGSKKTVLRGTFIEGDLKEGLLLKEIFKSEKILAVMHFAASTNVGESFIDPAKYYANNVLNSLVLLDAMRHSSVNNLIFSSSAAVYGIPQEAMLGESAPCLPINPYGETKLMAEKILRDFSKAYGLKYCALRYFNAAGGDPEGRIKYYKTHESNLIPLILNNLKNGGVLTINGTDYPTPDGTCIRDYIHVADLGEAHILALKKLLKEDCAPCYNLGNGQGYSIREVIKAAEKVTGRTVRVIEGKRRPGDPPVLLADAKKASSELGWSPCYPDLETMLEHAWKARS